ncbi:MAG: DUF11 domain-containing protein [Caldilineaceae bacterium]
MKNRISLYLTIPLFCGIYLCVLIAAFSTSTHAEPNSPWGTTPPTTDLQLEVVVTPDVVKNGQPMTITLDVVNRGQTNASAFTVTTYLPLPYLEILDCQGTSGAICQQQGMAYITKFTSIAVNQHQIVTIHAKARSNYAHITTTYVRALLTSETFDTNLLSNDARATIQLGNPVDLAVTQQISGADILFPGDPVTLTLNVQNLEANPLFVQPQQHFRNPAEIVMPDTKINELRPALTYPSVITVSGVNRPVVGVEVTFFAISRTWSEDIDVLLVGPTGVSVTLLSDVGGATELGAIDLTFSDNADKDATSQDVIPQGKYHPTNFARVDESLYDTYPAPGPGNVLDPVPYLGRFNGLNPNGQWKLYIVDDQPRDTGEIRFGWGITFTTRITTDMPIQLHHNAPGLKVIGSIAAPGWSITPTVAGFDASTIYHNGAVPSPIVLHTTAPITPGVYPVTTTLQAVTGDENLQNNQVQTLLGVGSLSDLALDGTVGPSDAVYGDQVTYQLTVTNRGPTFAPSASLKLHVADELSVIKATPSQGSCSVSGARVNCSSGDLPMVAGSNKMLVTIVADTPGGGLPGPYTIVTTATVESLGDPAPLNNSLTLSSKLGNARESSLYLPLVAR